MKTENLKMRVAHLLPRWLVYAKKHAREAEERSSKKKSMSGD